MSADLLIEIGTEDLPARYVLLLAEALGKTSSGLARRGIACGESRLYATPRRIAVLIEAVTQRQADQRLERKGPKLAAALKDGQPTEAGLGFAKSCGVAFSELAQEGGQLVFRSVQKGRTTAELLPEIFEETLKGMDEIVPKRMRWGSGEETFVRPVQWLVCMLGNKVIPIKRFGLKAGNKTYGHRFHAPKAITLRSPVEYEKKLKAARVWADFASRKAEIWRQIEAEAKKLKGSPHKNEDLLNEVTALVEWPVAIHGRMAERFMQLPPEVIIATIEHNQRYSPVFGKNGELLPYFITVSNIKSKDVRQVIVGNERVVTPRLADALFFWDQDLKQALERYGDKLKSVTFQKDLGTVADKVMRISRLSADIVDLLPSPLRGGAGGGGRPQVERAAALSKNDLVTRMVFEFPELQGLMGGYYAQKSGEPAAVARAIREHYLPTQQGTPIPSTREGQIVSLTDKLDTLAGIFAVGQRPTASKDPFALRRAALGILRICIEAKLPLNLRALLDGALKMQPGGNRSEATLNDLLEFVMERLRGYYEQTPVELFEAVKATRTTAPLDFDQRLRALQGFVGGAAAASLAAANKRMRNILKQADGKAGAEVSDSLLKDPAEQRLFAEMQRIEQTIAPLRAAQDYRSQLTALARLKEPVDEFFERVMVMADDPALRANRLALLKRLDGLCREVADLACLPG